MALEQVGYNSPEGLVAPGQHCEVIACGSATTLTASDSGALVLLDTAAGSVLTLPTPVAGMQFRVNTTVSVTSNSHIVTVADTTAEFLVGGVISANLTVAASGDFFVADGTTHVTITSNGSTTGGLIGGGFTLTAISATQWSIEGLICGSGTNADPFTT
jgi:hypothetical protein